MLEQCKTFYRRSKNTDGLKKVLQLKPASTGLTQQGHTGSAVASLTALITAGLYLLLKRGAPALGGMAPGWVQGLPSLRGVPRVATSGNFFTFLTQKFYILVHSWLRKWAPATLKNLASKQAFGWCI